jgi:poly-gamma-glutamate biosynthesis protein PgsC/CapC
LFIESIALGIVISLVLTEVVGLAAGGIVVPGYIAFWLHEPMRIAGTLLVALVTWGLVRLISRFTILYGRRLLVICILLGYALGFLIGLFPPLKIQAGWVDIHVVGYVIPGLIAYWIERQGLLATLCTMLVAASLTRFVVVAINGGALFP